MINGSNLGRTMPRHLTHIHPFPARMAPEIVFSRLADLPAGAKILDPMSGSGTVLRAASELGHDCVGFDLDPLAVLMSRVWTTPLDARKLRSRSIELLAQARDESSAQLEWVRECPETAEFISYWFEEKQARQLRRLARALATRTGAYSDALRIALSRTIITKERGASIARDASHSRPHRTFFENEYDVFAGFAQSVERLCDRLNSHKLHGEVQVHRGDARQMGQVRNGSVDAVVTSPPYLNAIDYLRGHRLSLVWLGHTLSSLRPVRAGSIGSEVSRHAKVDNLEDLLDGAGQLHKLPNRERGMVERYAIDIEAMLSEIARTLRPGGKAVLVVGNSRLKGVAISNARINVAAAKRVGLRHRHTTERVLPTSNRYLPMPGRRSRQALAMRMRTETVLSFTR
jgi:SAM-dependent methyltransferase